MPLDLFRRRKKTRFIVPLDLVHLQISALFPVVNLIL